VGYESEEFVFIGIFIFALKMPANKIMDKIKEIKDMRRTNVSCKFSINSTFLIYSHEFHLSIGIFGDQFVVTTIFIREGPVNQIEVHIVQANVLQGLTTGVFHPLRFVEVAPEL